MEMMKTATSADQMQIRKVLEQSFRRRHVRNWLVCGLLFLGGIVAIIPLLSVIQYVIVKGLPAINWSFFSELPKPVGEAGGGMANAVIGTLTLILLASVLGVFWGVSVGVYLSEFGKGKIGHLARFCAEMLSSIPSIIIGLFVYVLLVIPMKRFSALAGGVALGMIMIPTVARTTEELLKMVPVHVREAGLALGLPRWKVTLFIVLKGSLRGIVTGIMLAVARVSGETAPLLFTAFSNQFWGRGLDQPIASIPVQIYTYAISPYEDWHSKAWAGALVLILLVFSLNIVTRFVLRPAKGSKA